MATYRLVAFDLDGTLVGRTLEPSPRVRDAIARMRAGGVAGCLVTGRMYRASLRYARELGFDAPIVCYQGAAIVDPSTDEVLFDRPLDPETVAGTIAIASDLGVHLQLYRNDEYYSSEHNRFTDLYASVSQVEPVIVPSLRDAFAYSPATKAVAIADAAASEGIAREFGRRLGDRAYVTRSLPEFVEILDPTVDKGEALRFVARRLGVDMEAVLAIGDSWNDAPVLSAAGFGVAMGSAPPEVRKLADAVVADVAGDGVAEALERYVIG